ncbi:outer membrane protein transport protein [Desulfovibrio sp. OttesenSCG-928-G11]|nr:outer membrane protein transport protein [Desulfovibrio sp. OttesenSCG-928-G11]
MLKHCLGLALVLCLLAPCGPALADGFALYEYGARGVALGGAMMARKADPSAVAYNPALITQLKGTHVMGGVTAIYPKGKMRWTDPQSGQRGDSNLKHSIWYIPHAYLTHQINDDWFFGIGEFTRYGLGFEYPHEWPGRFNIYEVSLISSSLNPNIAWRATDKLSLALGVEIIYVNLDLKKRVNAAQGRIAGLMAEVDSQITGADAFGVGANIAAHYQFTDQWAVGLQYRSQARVHAFGDINFTDINSQQAFDSLPFATGYNFGEQFKDGTAHATVILPDSMAGGVSFTPIPELSFEVGAIWTRWSTFRSLNIHTPIGVTHSPKHWKDVWRLNAGAEWEALDWLTLRAGLVYDESPIPQGYEEYLVPTGDRMIYSGGLGFKWGGAWTLDLAYAIIKPKVRRYDRNDQMGVIDSRTENSHTQLFSLSLGYTF